MGAFIELKMNVVFLKFLVWGYLTKLCLYMILVEMESADKDKIKNCELPGNLKTSVTFLGTFLQLSQF